MRKRPWRAYGSAFLLVGCVALLAGVVETLCSDPNLPVSLADLIYGINLHLILAFLITSVLRWVAWRSSDHRFPFIAMGGVLVLECGLVAGYWASKCASMPPFHTLTGKLATVAVVGVGGLLGVALAFLAVRLVRHDILVSKLQPRVGPAGLVLAVLLVLGNTVALWTTWPPSGAPAAQPEMQDSETAKPDVFVILVDTLRRDHLSCFGYPRPTSPHIDQLLSDSWLFAAAYTPSSWTIPSVASLFTGLYPSAHKVTTGLHSIPADAPSLAGHLRGNGYRTAAFVANMSMTMRRGFSRGFDFFFPAEPPFWTHRRRTAIERIAVQLRRPGTETHGWKLNEQVLNWLRRTPDQPRFVYIHYMEPHSPYDPPREHREAVAAGVPTGPAKPPRIHDHDDQRDSRVCWDWECLPEPPHVPPAELAGMVANYDGEIHLVDSYLGELLRGLREMGILDDAHVLFCTDHGEEFGDHGGWFHENSIYEEMTASPMAYRPPGGASPGRVLDRPIAMLDLVRTLCTRIDVPEPPMHQGREIPEILDRDSDHPVLDVPVLCELPPYLYSLRWRQWKLIRRGSIESPDWKLFDLLADPGELNDLALALPDTLALLRAHTEGLLAHYAGSSLKEVTTPLDGETRDRLRTLGYIK